MLDPSLYIQFCALLLRYVLSEVKTIIYFCKKRVTKVEPMLSDESDVSSGDVSSSDSSDASNDA